MLSLKSNLAFLLFALEFIKVSKNAHHLYLLPTLTSWSHWIWIAFCEVDAVFLDFELTLGGQFVCHKMSHTKFAFESQRSYQIHHRNYSFYWKLWRSPLFLFHIISQLFHNLLWCCSMLSLKFLIWSLELVTVINILTMVNFDTMSVYSWILFL